MNRIFHASTLVLGSLLLSTAAQAAQMEVTRPELCSISKAVVLATVTDQETRWADTEDGGLERLTFIDVRKVVFGPVGSKAEVILPGGALDMHRHWVEDVPNLLVNGSYMLFLDEVDGHWQVIGGDQGAVRIKTPSQSVGEPVEKALSSVEVCHAK